MDEARLGPDEPVRDKARWECPSLVFVGNLKDLVRGETKLSGAPNDSDTVFQRQKSSGQPA
jgi:hypothetical protein